MTDFKIGDRVRLKEAYGRFPAGTVGTVETISIRVTTCADNFVCQPRRLEKVPVEESPKELADRFRKLRDELITIRVKLEEAGYDMYLEGQKKPRRETSLVQPITFIRFVKEEI